MSRRPRRPWVLPAQIATLVAVAVVVVIALTTSDDHGDHSASDTAEIEALGSVPPGTALTGQERVTPDEDRFTVELHGADGSSPTTEVLAAARSLLRRRLAVLVGCGTCIARSGGSFVVSWASGPGMPDRDKIHATLVHMGETALHPVAATTATAGQGCQPTWQPGPGDRCLQLGAPTTLPLTDVKLDTDHATDESVSIVAGLPPDGVPSLSALVGSCADGAATCPTKQIAVVVDGQVVETRDVSDAAVSGALGGAKHLTLGPMPFEDAHLVAASMITDPLLDSWTFEITSA